MALKRATSSKSFISSFARNSTSIRSSTSSRSISSTRQATRKLIKKVDNWITKQVAKSELKISQLNAVKTALLELEGHPVTAGVVKAHLAEKHP